MRSKFLLAGCGLAVVLTAVAVLGAVQHWWWLVVAAGMVLLSLTLLVAMDADRRARALRPYIRGEVTRGGQLTQAATAQPPTVSETDVIGTVRVLQAQYTGRMDRMQAALDEALAQLSARQDADRPAAGESDQE